MKTLSKLLSEVAELEERFLDKEAKTGNPEIDQEPVESDLPEDEFDEVAMMMEVTQNSVSNAMMSIEMMMRRGHKDKLISMFGEEAAAILQETYDCLNGVIELFDLAAKLPEEMAPEMEPEPEAEAPAEEKPEEEQAAEEPKEG